MLNYVQMKKIKHNIYHHVNKVLTELFIILNKTIKLFK